MSDNLKKVLIAGGGTGGHLFPAIAIGQELEKDNIEVKYIGSKYGIESSYKFINKDKLHLLNLRGIQRSISIRNIIRNLILPIKLIKSLYQVNSIIRTFKPDMIIGTGGYSCAIPLYVGGRKKILTAIQEQNVIPGMVTKKFCNQVNFIFTSFRETNNYLKHGKILLTGNPIRSMIKKIDMKKAKRHFGLCPKEFTILIIGGSQGAQSINKHIINNYKKYTDNNIQIIWQIGKNLKSFEIDKADKRIKIFSFIDEMDLAYSASNLIISRAGATAISEILYLEKPSILIPYPFAANNHQEINAVTLEKKNTSITIHEKDLKNGELEKTILELSTSIERVNFYKENIRKYSFNNSAYLIKEHIKDAINNAR